MSISNKNNSTMSMLIALGLVVSIIVISTVLTVLVKMWSKIKRVAKATLFIFLN